MGVALGIMRSATSKTESDTLTTSEGLDVDADLSNPSVSGSEVLKGPCIGSSVQWIRKMHQPVKVDLEFHRIWGQG
jgi:hypothetical protein